MITGIIAGLTIAGVATFLIRKNFGKSEKADDANTDEQKNYHGGKHRSKNLWKTMNKVNPIN